MADEHDLKSHGDPSVQDFEIGQILSMQFTPEEEKKVLRKLDLM
jgi:hypothetical protein